MIKYRSFWNQMTNLTSRPKIDLRELSLIFIVLSFGVLLNYQPFQYQETLSTISQFAMQASEKDQISQVLRSVQGRGLGLRDREEASLTWSWAARRALSESSRFYGESLDTVRTGVMVGLCMML
jgi:hypothetical protein